MPVGLSSGGGCGGASLGGGGGAAVGGGGGRTGASERGARGAGGARGSGTPGGGRGGRAPGSLGPAGRPERRNASIARLRASSIERLRSPPASVRERLCASGAGGTPPGCCRLCAIKEHSVTVVRRDQDVT